MGIFSFWKKKEKVIPQRKDYQDFKIEINMKTLMLYEEMSGKSFYDLSAEDFEKLIYCSLIINNEQKITYTQFQLIMKNIDIARTLYSKCQKELDFIAQFQKADVEATNTDNEKEKNKISDIINSLILQFGIDINYVMEKMTLWELSPLVKAMDSKSKSDMVEKRFWTYLQICPHIDNKKVKGPEKLLPFPWEKETEKNSAMKFMDDNKDAINAFFNKNKKEDGTI